MNALTLEDIKAFAAGELWTLQQPLTGATALAHDFGLAGHDGRDFMEAYALRFGVVMDGFDWVEYFGPESVGCPLGLLVWLYRRFVVGVPARHLTGLAEITLDHLHRCARAGRWEAPANGSLPAPKS
jgi:Protein of unknown function (DUF1493)